MKILDEVRNIIRVKHYSRHTESCYCDWIKHFILFQKMQTHSTEVKVNLI
ncbi:MAG: hypothetical protein Q9M50_13980 [Methylococcales bacterium]|nr:hypothetical protein [Methylococcales bacterium]